MPPGTGVPITLGDQSRRLRYTQISLEALEDKRGGEPLLQTVQSAGRLSAKAITVLLWAGLQHEDPRPSLDEVRALIVPPYRPYIDGIVEALSPWTKQPDDVVGKVEAVS